MPGTIQKRHLLKMDCVKTIYRMGGWRLILAVAMARRGTPFLSVLTSTQLNRKNHEE
jgi:hypothetical protein